MFGPSPARGICKECLQWPREREFLGELLVDLLLILELLRLGVECPSGEADR
jgi:hypothetical protein